MIVDCERCPGQHLSAPACPSCVVRLLLDTAPRGGGGAPPERVVPAAPLDAATRPVAVELVRRTDDLGRELDTREQRAVAVLTAAGLVAGGGGQGDRHRRSAGRQRRVRTA